MQKTVIVLGMHRSGTSMVSGILQYLNVDMGEDLLGKQWSNPLGHFEDLDFLNLNQEILASAGGSWNNPPKYEEIIALKDKYKLAIQELINRKNIRNSSKYWGWKDPRTSLTIDLYLPYISHPYVIWCHRDPGAISISLQNRNQVQPSKSLTLTNYYNNQIKEFTLRYPEVSVLSVVYEDVINAPGLGIDKIVQYLQLEPENNQINQAIEIILSPTKLRKEKWRVLIIHYLTTPYRLFKKVINNCQLEQ